MSTDLALTLSASAILVAAAGVTLALLPWSNADLDRTERLLERVLRWVRR